MIRLPLIGCTSMLALASALAPTLAVAAPEAAPEGGDTIVVTGLGQSINATQNLKRHASVEMDSILADDIASFPETNLAEAIQRVPGVAITRDAGGEGKQVSLRGFTPDYTLVRLNGMPALSTANSIDSRGGTSNSRSFDFNIFAAELFNRIDVRKSGEASVEEGGIGGTIDLFTARALDYKAPRFALSAQGFYNSYSKTASPRIAGLASWRNQEGTLGALVSVAYSEREVVEKGFSTVRWGTGGWNLNNVSSSVSSALTSRLNAGAASASALYFPRYLRYDLYDWKQKRLGITTSLQFHPSSDLQFDLDGLYGRLKDQRDEYHLDANAWSTSTGLANTTINSLGVTGNNITSGSFSNVWVRSDTGRYDTNNDYYQLSLTSRARLSDRLTLDTLTGYNLARLTMNRYEFYYTHGDSTHTSGGTTMSYDFSQNPDLPVINYGINVNDPNSYIFNLMRLQRINVIHNNMTGKLNLHYELNPDLTLHFGGFINRQMINYRAWAQTDETSGVANSSPTAALTTLPFNYASGLGVSGLPAGWAVADLDKDIAAMNANGYSLAIDTGATFRVIETVSGGYGELGFQGSLFGRDIDGNAGLRIANTHTKSEGYVGGLWVGQGNSYLDFLPSLNAVMKFGRKLQLRLAADRNLSRPTLGDLSIGGGSVDPNNRIITTGNINLKPFRADSLSLSAEYYASARTMFAITPFFKHIEDLIVSSYYDQPYSATGLPLSLLNAATTTNTADTIFTMKSYSNAQQANVKGVELTGNVGFDFLPGLLKNTGVLANYTLADGSATYTNATTGIPFRASLPNLTRHSANITAYYTDKKVDARVSVSYHGRYLTDLPSANGNDMAGYNPSTHVDASLRYNINRLLAVTFDAVNLTNAADSQFVGNAADGSNRVYTYLKSGRSFMVGARIGL
jgi:iron complex outermembrane recepter protein